MPTTVRGGHALCATMVTAALIFCVPARVHAQRLDHIGVGRPAAPRAAAPQMLGSHALVSNADAASKRRSALIGAVIGGVAGAVACTVIAERMDDSAVRRVRGCPADTYVFFIAGGFAIGALVGWLVG